MEALAQERRKKFQIQCERDRQRIIQREKEEEIRRVHRETIVLRGPENCCKVKLEGHVTKTCLECVLKVTVALRMWYECEV